MMTVKDLKKVLEELQDDAVILVQGGYDSDFADDIFVSDIKINDKWRDMLVISAAIE